MLLIMRGHQRTLTWDVRAYVNRSPGRILTPIDVGFSGQEVLAYRLGHDVVTRAVRRADLSCLAWIGIASVFGLAMIPVRAWLLGAPERLPWLVALLGSRSGTAGLGSLVRVGTGIDWVWPILLGTLLSMKFD